jgi:hypothetical protein
MMRRWMTQQGPYLVPAGAPPGMPLLHEEERPPEAVYYFRIYAVLVIIILLGTAGGGVYAMVKPLFSAAGTSTVNDWVGGLVTAVFCGGLVVPHVLALFGGRKSWVYTLSLVLIGVNLVWGICCCLPVNVPLLIVWMKPETKRWYGAT